MYLVPFADDMVCSLLAETKTQTRRIMKPQPKAFAQRTPDVHPTLRDHPYIDAYCGEPKTLTNPRGMSNEWHWWTADHRLGEHVGRCDYGIPGDRLWVPSRHLSRITLDIITVRVERLNEISETDAKAEGVDGESLLRMGFDDCVYRAAFRSLWERLYGQGSWELNPYVWVIEFKKTANPE